MPPGPHSVPGETQQKLSPPDPRALGTRHPVPRPGALGIFRGQVLGQGRAHPTPPLLRALTQAGPYLTL